MAKKRLTGKKTEETNESVFEAIARRKKKKESFAKTQGKKFESLG